MSSIEITNDTVAYLEARLSELRDLENGKVKCKKCGGCGVEANPTILEMKDRQIEAMKAGDEKKVQEIITQIQAEIDSGTKEEYDCFDCAGTGKQRPLMGLTYIMEELAKVLEVAKAEQTKHEAELLRD